MAKYKVLSTKKLDRSLVDQAAQNGIDIIEREFISIQPKSPAEIKQAIDELSDRKNLCVAFTSANAVDSLASYSTEGSFGNWKIFCLAGKTKERLEAAGLGKNIVGVANNAAQLAENIIERRVDHIIFFCGDRRRDELPDKLREANVKVVEVVLYETIDTPSTISDKLDGILFFSPSGVESFFSLNRLSGDVLCFAIGATTAAAIAGCTNNSVAVCSVPDSKAMVEKVIEHFEEKSAVN